MVTCLRFMPSTSWVALAYTRRESLVRCGSEREIATAVTVTRFLVLTSMIITATVIIKMDVTITGDHLSSRRILGLVAVLLGQFMLMLDATVVNVALPAMQVDLALTSGELTWITNAYMIAFGGLLLLFGRLG